MKGVLIAAGIVMLLSGLTWTLQGLGYVGGSAMSGNSTWAIIGPIMAGLGVSLIIVAVQRRS